MQREAVRHRLSTRADTDGLTHPISNRMHGGTIQCVFSNSNGRILRKVIVSDSRYALSLASVKGWNMGCNDGSAVGIKTA